MRKELELSHKAVGIRNWLLLAAIVSVFAVGGFAIAQEGGEAEPTQPAPTETEEDLGPPWMRPGAEDWTPNTPGPPPWAGQDDDDDGDGLGPRWLRGDAGDWKPGTQGPPPWANARFLRPDAGDWKPGTPGPPPWAGQDDADEADEADD